MIYDYEYYDSNNLSGQYTENRVYWITTEWGSDLKLISIFLKSNIENLYSIAISAYLTDKCEDCSNAMLHFL